jgi:heat shock protein HslJ
MNLTRGTHPAALRVGTRVGTRVGARLGLVVMVPVLVLAACGSKSKSTSNGATTTAAASGGGAGGAPALEGTPWVLGTGVTAVPTADKTRPTLMLKSGTASGFAGCNNFHGTYTVNGSSLSFGPLGRTAMACGSAQDAIETAYLAQLAKVASYAISGQTLTLKDSSGAAVLSYAPSTATLQGAWEATSYLKADGSAITSVIVGSTLTADFGADGNVTGDTGCNFFNGAYKVDGDKITIGPLITTRKACSSDDLNAQEHSYLTALESAATYTVSAQGLTLLNAKGQMAATFIPS